ncbi:MAG: hypothetical protein A2Z25_02260, partial [Planctomycetes bacterium RBG_16_55_9]
MTEELIGIIGGTGLGDALAEHIENAQLHDIVTPFGKPSTAILVGTFGKRKIAFLNRHGTGHKLPPSEVPFAANIFALKKLGAHTVLSSGAVGSLRDEIAPGHLVVVDQFIDKTHERTRSFFAGYGAVHCEMSEPTCGRLRRILVDTAKGTKDGPRDSSLVTRDSKDDPSIVHRPSSIVLHPSGTYVCMEGPQFSTRAESLMHRAWGGDLIGMTAMPEAKLAREAQMCYVLVALASDYDCWKAHDGRTDKQRLLEEILGNLQKATNNCLELIEAVLTSDHTFVSEDCPCRKSLDLAVWTDQ